MFSDPAKNVGQCGIQAGMDIADFGSGSGFYTLEAARALISTGRVYSIDLHQELLSKTRNHASQNGLHNVEVIVGDIEKQGGSKLRESSIDLVFMCNIMFQLEHKEDAVKEAKRVLKPGGRILVVDWEDSFGNMGPHPENIFKKGAAHTLFEKNGFHLDREIEAGSHHYGFIFKKL